MIDLHIHTNYSGGQSNLKEVLQIAQRRKVSIIAITDNNTCEAYKELNNILIAKYYEGKIIPGCEFSTIVNNVPIELIDVILIQIWHKKKYRNYIYQS